MELDTQNVFDFSREGYVHRLISNQIDGKLVALEDPNEPGLTDPSDQKSVILNSLQHYNKKVESLNKEYN